MRYEKDGNKINHFYCYDDRVKIIFRNINGGSEVILLQYNKRVYFTCHVLNDTRYMNKEIKTKLIQKYFKTKDRKDLWEYFIAEYKDCIELAWEWKRYLEENGYEVFNSVSLPKQRVYFFDTGKLIEKTY